jgi:hypothetical protein
MVSPVVTTFILVAGLPPRCWGMILKKPVPDLIRDGLPVFGKGHAKKITFAGNARKCR